MPPYPRRNARRYPIDISPDDYDLGMNSDYDPLDEVERAEMQNWLRDNTLRGRPRTGRISTEEMIYAYQSDDDLNDTPYRRRRREDQRRRNRNRSRSRSRERSKSDQERTEHHHHHHVVIYNPTNNSNNSDSSLYTPRNQQLPQAQTLCPTTCYTNRQGIAYGPLGPRGIAIGGIGAGPRALLQQGLNQCTCCCCMTARSHQGPMTPGVYARQFGQQRLLQ